MDNLPEGKTWFVAYVERIGMHVVLSRKGLTGIRDCALQALAGDPDAVAALLMCPDDEQLRHELNHGIMVEEQRDDGK